MPIAVTVSEYLAQSHRLKRHALSPCIGAAQADACVALRFSGDTIKHAFRHRPHYKGPAPQWPNLIGRNALSAYAKALPVVAWSIGQETRSVGHRALSLGVGVGLALGGYLFGPLQPSCWVVLTATSALAYFGARASYQLCHKPDAQRLEHLLNLSCIAARAYLGEFGEVPPVDAEDMRLDVVSAATLDHFAQSTDIVCQQAYGQYTHWAADYRFIARLDAQSVTSKR